MASGRGGWGLPESWSPSNGLSKLRGRHIDLQYYKVKSHMILIRLIWVIKWYWNWYELFCYLCRVWTRGRVLRRRSAPGRWWCPKPLQTMEAQQKTFHAKTLADDWNFTLYIRNEILWSYLAMGQQEVSSEMRVAKERRRLQRPPCSGPRKLCPLEWRRHVLFKFFYFTFVKETRIIYQWPLVEDDIFKFSRAKNSKLKVKTEGFGKICES